MMFKTNFSITSKHVDKLKFLYKKGFVATIAVTILATGCLVFSLATLLGATSYAESVYKRELRIQAGLNARACLDLVTLMISKDYFLSDQLEIRHLDCVADVINDLNGEVSFVVETRLGTVGARLTRMVRFEDFMLKVI